MASSAPPMVDYTEFDPSKVTSLSPREKEWSNGTEKGKYKELPLMYDYGADGQKKVDKIYMQYPEMKIPRGINEKMNERGGYMEYSVMVVFNMGDPEHQKVVGSLNGCHKQIANLIDANKGPLGLHHFNAQMPEASGLGGMIYLSRDKVTGEVLEGKDPTQFYKMYKNTIFADLTGKSIDHSILKDAEITGYPLVCHTHVYVGSKVTIKSHLQSFIVTGVKKSDGLARQVSTIGRVLEQNPEAQTNLEAQIAALMGDNQDVLIQGNPDASLGALPDIESAIQAPPVPTQSTQTIQSTEPVATSEPVPSQPAPEVTQVAPVQAAPASQPAPSQDLQAFLAQAQTAPAAQPAPVTQTVPAAQPAPAAAPAAQPPQLQLS